jgi:hypothetical protein
VPLLNFSVWIDQVEAGLRFEGDYWEMANQWCYVKTLDRDNPATPVGMKRQTIRALRKYPFKVGDNLYLYTGCRTKQARKLGEAQAREVFTIGMDIPDPKNIAPWPTGETRIWKLVPLETPVLGFTNRAECMLPSQVEDLAILDGFNTHPIQWGVYTVELIERLRIHFEALKMPVPKPGANYLLPGQYDNAVDMLTWFSKAHGDKDGKIENKFFQVLRW